MERFGKENGGKKMWLLKYSLQQKKAVGSERQNYIRQFYLDMIIYQVCVEYHGFRRKNNVIKTISISNVKHPTFKIGGLLEKL